MRLPRLGLSLSRRQVVHDEIAAMSTPRPSFYLMDALSTVIATYGLLANSTAVVIGAMLVAPLMGPIFGVALAVTAGDRVLLRKAATASLYGVLISIGLAAGLGLLPLRLGFGSEIMARTQPTLYDIIVALASGLAGAYALVDERIGPALPGVAIATALVPPLATCGLCLAAGHWTWAWGAWLLFLANFVAIQLAAAFVFGLFGLTDVAPHEAYTLVSFLRRFQFSLLVLLAVGVFMTATLARLVAERRFSEAVTAALSEELTTALGAHLSSVSHVQQEGTVQLTATVLTPREIEPAQVGRLEQRLRQRLKSPIRLLVRSLIAKDLDRHGPVYIQAGERERHAARDERAQRLARVTDQLTALLQDVDGARLADVRREDGADGTQVTVVVHTPVAVSPAQVAAMERALRSVEAGPVRLVVRSILTRDADSQRFLHEPARVEPRPLTGSALTWHRRLETALRNQLEGRYEGAEVTEFQYAEDGERYRVFAVVRTPRPFEPDQVAEAQVMLRRYLRPDIELIVRSQVGADTTANGYVVTREVAP